MKTNSNKIKVRLFYLNLGGDCEVCLLQLLLWGGQTGTSPS